MSLWTRFVATIPRSPRRTFTKLRVSISKSSRARVFGVILIPLTPSADWHHIPFTDRTPNNVEFTGDKINVLVRASSSPLFYKLPKTIPVTEIKLRAQIAALPDLKGEAEGSAGGDDSALRIGLVEANDSPPGAIARLFLPRWIRQILEFLPDQGVEKVFLYSLSQQHPPGTILPRPGMKIINEVVMLNQTQPGIAQLAYPLQRTIPTSALWLQSDGDDTKSTFRVIIEMLELGTP